METENLCQLVFKVAILLGFVIHGADSIETGPYVLTNLHLFPCGNQGTNEMHFSVHMYRTQDRTTRRFLHRGELSVPSKPDTYRVFMKVYKWATDWILVTDYEEELCKALSLSPFFYAGLCRAAGINDTCPPPPGRHTFEAWDATFQPVPPILPYGQYKSIIDIKNGKGEVIGCVAALYGIEKK